MKIMLSKTHASAGGRKRVCRGLESSIPHYSRLNSSVASDYNPARFCPPATLHPGELLRIQQRSCELSSNQKGLLSAAQARYRNQIMGVLIFALIRSEFPFSLLSERTG
jgi:hypothetical protein